MENHQEGLDKHNASTGKSANLRPDGALVTASLSIHRCHSDGVLTDHNGLIQGKLHLVRGKSSSESSINGNNETDTSSDLSGHGAINENVSDYVNHNVNGDSETAEDIGSGLVCNGTASVNGVDSYHDGVNSDNMEIVRPKTWRCRVMEQNMDKLEDGAKSKRRNGEHEHMNSMIYKFKSNSIGTDQRSDYTCQVCDTHRRDTDLIYGRTRGGIRSNVVDGIVPDVFICIGNGSESSNIVKDPKHDEHVLDKNLSSPVADNGAVTENIDLVVMPAGSASEMVSTCPSVGYPPVHAPYPTVHAPLAQPENFSDDEALGTEQYDAVGCDVGMDEVGHGLGVDNGNLFLECFASAVEQGRNEKESVQCKLSNNNNDIVQQTHLDSAETVVSCCMACTREHFMENSSSQGENEMSRGGGLDHRLMSQDPDGNTQPNSCTRQDSCGHLGDRHGAFGNTRQNRASGSNSESLESLDDIGDFIEADLPPNVERLAFFSRDSSTDEDEGCGDEVLQDNMGEDSDNETINPLGNFRNSSFQHRPDDIQQLEGAAASVSGVESDYFSKEDTDVLSRNFSFRKPTAIPSAGMPNEREKNEQFEDPLTTEANINGLEGSSYNRLSFSENEDRIDRKSFSKGDSVDSSVGRDMNSASSSTKGDHNCVSCDRFIVNTSEKIAEYGVLVCDRCYNESDVALEKPSNVVIVRSRTGIPSASCSNSNQRFLQNDAIGSRNRSGQLSQDKLNNICFDTARHSSSDSDPFDRLALSDSSELVSPDAEASAEMMFPSTSSLGYDVTAHSSQCDCTLRGQEQAPPLRGYPGALRQAMSLDCEGSDEVLYCPFYTRRSRSLDQELQSNDSFVDRVTNEIPNISVNSSNFQDDESNNQQKVFEKQAYNVCIPACSSSDEEENTHVHDDRSHPVIVMSDSHAALHRSDRSIINGDSRGREATPCMMQAYCNDLDFDGRQPCRNALDDEPIYEDIDDLEMLLEEACANGEPDNRETARPLCTAISKLRRKRRRRSPVSSVEKVMIWNEYEAYVVQVKQIGTSACGPTAVLNVLKAFDFQVEKEEVGQTIVSNLRMEAAPIPYYLFSRFGAGTTAQALVEGVATITRGAIKGRFFHFYPQRDVELLKWLGYWMKKGAVPVATLNLQRGVKPGWTIPDAWHHQMVYGVSSKGVYLTNPLEIVPESVILEQLTSDSVLLVRRQDVVSRFRDWCPLNEILKQRDTRWRTMNVLGQIVHMLREQCRPQESGAAMHGQQTSHIRIPAAYKAGIILFMRVNSDAYEELTSSPELPVKDARDTQARQYGAEGLPHGFNKQNPTNKHVHSGTGQLLHVGGIHIYEPGVCTGDSHVLETEDQACTSSQGCASGS